MLEGKETVNILWDVASFYETCQADAVVLAAEALDMLPTATALAMWGTLLHTGCSFKGDMVNPAWFHPSPWPLGATAAPPWPEESWLALSSQPAA